MNHLKQSPVVQTPPSMVEPLEGRTLMSASAVLSSDLSADAMATQTISVSRVNTFDRPTNTNGIIAVLIGL